MKLKVDTSYTEIEFKRSEGDLRERVGRILDNELSVLPKGYEYSWAFRHGQDASVKFYDLDTHKFPTGLLPRVKHILDTNEIPYDYFDTRPDLFVDASAIPQEVKLMDGPDGEITLRDYQRDAVVISLAKGYGIVNTSVGSGKCLPADTLLLTTEGYRSIKDIFKDEGVSLDAPEGSVHLSHKTVLINRFGKPEDVDLLTVNGLKSLIKVTLDNGFSERMTFNHPLLVEELNGGTEGFTWKEAQKLSLGDKVKVFHESKGKFWWSKIVSLEVLEPEFTYDVSMPKTHSFIANGMVNHNTEIASAIMSYLLPELQKGERVVMFVGTKEIFNQTIERFKKRLGIDVGYLGDGKKKMSTLMVALLPTVNSYLNVDPAEKLKLSGKKALTKKIALNYAPQFMDNPNAYAAFKGAVKLMHPRTKVEETIKAKFQDDLDTVGSDRDVQNLFKKYHADWIGILEEKSGAKLKKQRFIHKFLDSIVGYIADECHHSSSDTWFNSLMQCNNAIYHIGLSATVDQKDALLWTRLRCLFTDIVAQESIKDMAERGVLAKGTVYTMPITNKLTFEEKDYFGTDHKKHGSPNWQNAYRVGIVENDHRNNCIAGIIKKAYETNNSTLVVVSYIEHGERLGKILESVGIPYVLMNGDQSSEFRNQVIQDAKDGSTKVIIATSIMDEGVDISGLDVLVLASGGKSFKQVVQRVGRVLRHKDYGGNQAKIFDFEDKTNSYLRKHSKERLELYKEQGFPIVPLKEADI